MQAEQLPFQFDLSENMTLENFHPGRQPLLLQICHSLANVGEELQLYIYGEKGLGKTHLLIGCCQLALQNDLRVAYLPARKICGAEVLRGLDQLDLVCIDDIDELPTTGEVALFNLINAIRNIKGRLVFSSKVPPSDLDIELADLRSRLLWGPVFQLEPLKDKHVKEALLMRAAALGLDLPNDVAEYIFTRETRDFTALDKRLQCLLNAAAVTKRRFTKPFVKQVLGL